MHRRSFLTAAGAASVTAVIARPGWSQATAGRTLKFVPQANLSILDPVFTTAAVSITHGYCVFDTLYGVDDQLKPQPQMADRASVSDDGLEWLITLREGLLWHDGTAVTAEDCSASLDRWSLRDTFGQSLRAVTEAFEAADDATIRIRLTKPFPRLLEAIGKPHSSPAMMMPKRLAETPPTEPVTEMIGSGPFRFVAEEYISGSRVVYEKFADYKPRSEAPSWTAGGKVVNVERLEWHIIPDAATATTALMNGEVDWVEVALPDLLPLLETQPALRIQHQDPSGNQAFIRFNCLIPPFDNVDLRRAVMMAVEQQPYMQAITGGVPDAWMAGKNAFPATMPGVDDSFDDMMPGDIEAARAAVAAAGYDGTPVVILHPADHANIAPLGLITASLLEKIGFNVQLETMDWGTLTHRRQSKAPVDSGGWNIFHTYWSSASIATPPENSNIRGNGEEGWYGWYHDPTIEAAVDQWLSVADPSEQAAIFRNIQKMAMEGAPAVPLGIFFVNSTYDKKLSGIIPGSASYFWNVV